VANTLNLFRNGGVGFLDWLGLSVSGLDVHYANKVGISYRQAVDPINQYTDELNAASAAEASTTTSGAGGMAANADKATGSLTETQRAAKAKNPSSVQAVSSGA
jgi:hypothetical protein